MTPFLLFVSVFEFHRAILKKKRRKMMMRMRRMKRKRMKMMILSHLEKAERKFGRFLKMIN